MSLDDFRGALLEIANSSVLALDDLWTFTDPEGGSQISILDTIQDPGAVDPESEAQASELKDRLADAIESLPERERLVIALYYYENLTLREIGEVLDVTESRVSQLHTKAVIGCARVSFYSLRGMAAQASRPHPQRRACRSPGERQDQPRRGDPVRVGRRQPPREGRRDGTTVCDFEDDEQERGCRSAPP